ncbi:hypothetical protein F2Q69_00028743 [Brassica cretica]|uniref:Uncharacterized protein n=1 Tax=Brassica cretica TaxID=69181 RepID=A0A8S9S4U2_BRACR|nr:hypothetical protein F2Q69_00028743 [Brassica cretica]
MGINGECIEDLKTNLLSKVHDEIQKMKIDMMKQFINLGETISHLAEIVREMKAGDGRVNGGTASQPATQIITVAADLQVPEVSMELYDRIYGAPIFDVYDDKEPSCDVHGDAVPIFVICITDNSSFAPLPRNNELFKEFIDVSHIKVVITRLWIRSVAHKTYGLSISAPTHSIHSHELLTATPKKLNEKNPVPGCLEDGSIDEIPHEEEDDVAISRRTKSIVSIRYVISVLLFT